jgi:hypothetical protein
VLVTHDRTTMPGHVSARRRHGLGVPGVVIVRLEEVATGRIIDDLLFLIDAATPEDWKTPLFIP